MWRLSETDRWENLEFFFPLGFTIVPGCLDVQVPHVGLRTHRQSALRLHFLQSEHRHAKH
jgi:hypothetical protein